VRQLARRIEARHPDLDGRLITAVQQRPGPSGALSYLQERLLRETLEHGRTREWAASVPGSRILVCQLAHWLALALFVLGLLAIPNKRPVIRPPVLPTGPGNITVVPGDTSVEKGSPLVVLAKFEDALPAGVELVLAETGTTTNRRVPLVRSLADPVFGGSIPELVVDLSYRLEYAGRRTRDYKVTVFEYPKLERADLNIVFPEYTGLHPRQIPDTRRLSGVEGSAVDLNLMLNKPVVSAALVSRDEDKRRVTLATETNRPIATLTGFALAQSGSFDLQLIDVDGRTNKVPAQFVFEVVPNRTPEIKIASPRGDLRPSALEEISFGGEVWDDFGVSAYGLAYATVGSEIQYLELGQPVPGKEKRSFQHVLSLEELSVEPDQVISWFVWADDVGPDGQVRRSTGDLYFAEVRPFEEIFREGQGMEGQGQQGQQQGGQQQNDPSRLAELQKSIINATWKLMRQKSALLPVKPSREGTNRLSRQTFFTPHRHRRPGDYTDARAGSSETSTRSLPMMFAQATARRSSNRPTGESVSGTYEENANVVRDSQAHVLEQLGEGAGSQSDARARALLADATRKIEKALALLDEARTAPQALPEALAAEQAAYEALLKLHEHEYQVSRSRRQSGCAQAGSREQMMQRQLDQMDLTQTENRYETQRQAQRPQSAQRTEQLAVLDKLRELARRQQDLNQRFKELQTELREARTEAERQEIQRRLKRLQEQQRQMLSDLDELRQRMDRPENQSRLADQREQLERTREDVQRSAEAAGQGSPSEALASGTRAERQLEEMREQIRKQSSGEFSDEMRELRSEARELARNQQEISNQIEAGDSRERKSLSGGNSRSNVLERLTEQQRRLTNLVDRASQVSQQAETSEPLLSKEL
jgi:hypothetical protein